MKVSIRDLGVLKQADFEVGNLTVICGENNTGKTYATYALYGFLHYWNSNIDVEFIDAGEVDILLRQGKLSIEIGELNRDYGVSEVCTDVSHDFARIFGSSEKNFTNASISVSSHEVASTSIDKTRSMRSSNGDSITLQVVKENLATKIDVHLKSISQESNGERNHSLYFPVNWLIKDALYDGIYPYPFIASIERTGAAMFQKELDIRRNQLLESINDKKNASNAELFQAVKSSRYALPVKHDIDFNRDLEYRSKFESEISKNNPKIVDFFNLCAGGQYVITKEGTYFSPHTSKVRLTMGESASSIRSLLNLGMFIKHIAKPGSLLMIDEPELNLHPKNQRMIARLMAKLVNAGVRVYITTHSDYIIREFNTLIMLKSKGAAARRIMEKYGYNEDELLDVSDIKTYRARQERIHVEGRKSKKLCNVITPAIVDEQGIEIDELDDTIIKMNEMQDEIIFSEAKYD